MTAAWSWLLHQKQSSALLLSKASKTFSNLFLDNSQVLIINNIIWYCKAVHEKKIMTGRNPSLFKIDCFVWTVHFFKNIHFYLFIFFPLKFPVIFKKSLYLESTFWMSLIPAASQGSSSHKGGRQGLAFPCPKQLCLLYPSSSDVPLKPMGNCSLCPCTSPQHWICCQTSEFRSFNTGTADSYIAGS